MTSTDARTKIRVQNFPSPRTGNNSDYEDVAAPQRPNQTLKGLKESNTTLLQRIKDLKTDLKRAQVTGQETSEKLAKTVAFNQEKAVIIDRQTAEISKFREEDEKQKSNIDGYKNRIYAIEKELQETTNELDKQRALNRNSSLSHEIDKMRFESEKLRENVKSLAQKVDDLNIQLMYKDAMWKEEQETNQKERANLNLKLDSLLEVFQAEKKQNEEYRIKKEKEDTKRHESLRQAVADRRITASPVLLPEQKHGQVLLPIIEDRRAGQNGSKRPRSTINLADISARRLRPIWSSSTKPTYTRPGSEKM